MGISRLIFSLGIAVASTVCFSAAAQIDGSAAQRTVKSVTTTKVTTTTETRIIQADSIDMAPQDSMREGGRLVWVPDSMISDVKTLLKGHSRVVDDQLRLDLDEKVVYRGDTIPMVLKTKNFSRFDRGLFNMLFIPKGTWSFGLTASYGDFSVSDLGLFDLMDDIDMGAHQFQIKPYVSYFIKNNLSLCARFAYTRSKASLGSLKLDIDEDMNFSLKDIDYNSESYTAAVAMQQYFGITRRGRFGIFNEVELSFSSGNSDFNRPYDGEIKRTHTTNMEARLTFSPGVCVFVMKNVSFNVSFGVFGFYLRNERQTVDGEPIGNRFTSGANFKINLFNLAFGLAVHI